MKNFIITSLLSAGFPSETETPNLNNIPLLNENGVSILATKDLPFTLIGHSSHRSHGSHSSHGSHGSHRSSSGGSSKSYSPPSIIIPAPNRNNNSTPPSSILPQNPKITVPQLKGNTAAFIELTRKVQMMLYALGYYSGAINGRVNPETSSAISSYQSNNGLRVTGKINDSLVKSLNVPLK